MPMQSRELTEYSAQNHLYILPSADPSPSPFNLEHNILRRLPISLELAKPKTDPKSPNPAH